MTPVQHHTVRLVEVKLQSTFLTIMLKRSTSRCSHPIDATPFEAFYHGSWHGTKHVSIKSGSIFVQFHQRGSMLEDKIYGDCLRMRSRKASSFDCSHFLKPGIDVCVLSAHPIVTSSDEELQTPLLSWHDAKIISIKRTPHVNRCACLFSVVYCKSNSPTSMQRSTNERVAEVVTIDNIAILQKLKNEPCENGCHQWNSTEDCISSSKSKLLNDAFSSEISWLLVLSTLKRMDFDLKLVQNKIVYYILYSDGRSSTADVQSDGDSDAVSPSSDKSMKVIRFQRCNEYLRPKVETFVLGTHKEMPVPETTVEMDINDSDADNDSDVEILYDHMNLRHSKRHKTQPDRFSSFFSPDFDRCSIRNVTCEMNRMEQDDIPTPYSSRSGLSAEEKRTAATVQQMNISDGKCMKLHSHRSLVQNKMILKDLCKRVQRGIISSLSNKFDHLSSQSYLKRGSNRRKLLSAAECKHLIEKCMGNIKCETERNMEPVVQWPTYKPTNFPEEPPYFRWTPSDDTQLENQEHEDLWNEMEQSLTTLALLEQKQVLDSKFLDGATNSSMRDPERPQCHHDYTLKEDIGVICRLCNFICTEIRYVSPPFGDYSVTCKDKFGVNKLGILGLYDLESDPFSKAISSWDITLSEGCDNICTLIPDFKSKLHHHQKRAFEFIWRNIAGSLKPEEMNHDSGNTGGCVISHSPGSGKTLLIISFIVSYLKLYPRSRPLVLAPKTAVHTWCREFQKWEVSIPLYLIHREQGYGKEFSTCKIRMFSIDARRPNRKMMHVMSCLEKLRKWHEEPSILLMNYSSFFSMAKEDSNVEYRKFMAGVLQKSPGLLILDEGHNPRSTNSKLRKLLMKVKTEYRILLSGTLFQNNFEEYFNTLSLARPHFIHDAISELDPYMVNIFHSRKHKRGRKINRKERLARKLFVEKVGQKIESSEEDDRKKGLDLLNRITSGFVDVHEGEISNMLPGLQIYTLLLSSTDLQRQILMKLQNSVTHKRCPLELESLITVGSIHPWLIKTIAGVDNYFSAEELKNIDACKENYMSGPKVKFVIDLVHKSASRGERVLIFCHNISPINLLVKYFELVFGWHREEEVLVLQGDQELSMRAKIMDKFNGDVKGKSNVLLASTTACAEGISLTAASRLVMLDSEWNHSKTRQAIARAFRPGQERVVYVYLLLASGTWEEGKYESNARKAWMSKMIFIGQYIEYSSSRQADDIDDELLRELVEEDQKRTFQMIKKHD